MEKSQNITNLMKGLLIFQSEVGKISKKSTNPYFKSKYASLAEILNCIKEPLQIAGLVIMQIPTNDGLSTALFHAESGEFIESSYTMPIVKQDPQAMGSAITYARRYALSAILSLNIEDDDDGEKAMFRGDAGSNFVRHVPIGSTGSRIQLSQNLDELKKSFLDTITAIKSSDTTEEKKAELISRATQAKDKRKEILDKQ